MSDKISVIVPYYNRKDYIVECVESLISQTYPIDSMELIFVDDGSTDNTTEILKEYEERFPENIMIVELPENSGGRAGYVRNIGVSYASGDYIMFVDSDDVVDAGILEKMHALSVEYSADVVSANMQMFAGEKVLMTEAKDDRFFDVSDGQSFIDLLASEGTDGHIGARLYRRSFLDEYGIRFNDDRHVSEDTGFNLRCLLNLSRYYRTSEVLYYYRNNAYGLWRADDRDPGQIMECILTQEELYPLYVSRLSAVPEVVEWFFFQALSNVRARLFDMGQQEYYYGRLPEIRDSFMRFVPGLKDNRILASQLGDDTVKSIYSELFLEGDK